MKRLAIDCSELADIKYDFLFDESRRLLAIGYNVDDSRRDESCYDLLASEARLCSYVAIAQGRLKQEHWFALGRMLTKAGGELALLSWGGTMFEYLMPLLIMPTYENTLLNQTLSLHSQAADRIWATTKCSLGHLRIRLQSHRCQSDLPVQSFRSAGPWI